MARGRSQAVAEALVRPWWKRTRLIQNPERELQLRLERSAEGLFTEQVLLVRTPACYCETASRAIRTRR
jgi:hypothetical protein